MGGVGSVKVALKVIRKEVGMVRPMGVADGGGDGEVEGGVWKVVW